MRTLLSILALSTVSSAAVLTLTPSEAASVAPGDFAGWGYSLFQSDGYAVPTFSEFSPASTDGSYIDFVVLPVNYLVIASTTHGGQDFDPVLLSGAGMFVVDPSAVVGTIINGTITLHYDLYSADPNIDPGTFLSGDNTVSANVSVTVTAPEVASPEPATFGLLLGSLTIGLLVRSRRRLGNSHLQ